MLKIELLSKIHDRDNFDCGSEPLNIYLRQIARQHSARGISQTFVLVDEQAIDPKPVLGFFALNICQVLAESLPPEEAKKLPRKISAVRMGRLAVSKNQQRLGHGKRLMVGAMKKFLEVFDRAGGIGLFVDAKDQEARSYYQQFGFVSLPSNELELFLPLKTIQEALS